MAERLPWPATKCASPNPNSPSACAWICRRARRPTRFSRFSMRSTRCIPPSRFRIRALEISSAPAPRRSSPTTPARICLCSGLPRPRTGARCDLVEERPVTTMRGQQFVGHGKNVLGDPRVALTWLANELRQLGVTLKGGQHRHDRHLPSTAADPVRRFLRRRFRRAWKGVGGVQVGTSHPVSSLRTQGPIATGVCYCAKAVEQPL